MSRSLIECVLTHFFVLFLMASPSQAKTVYCTNCSDKWQQAIEKATGIDQLKELGRQVGEAIQQTHQQITMVAQNIEQYENMIMNTNNLPMDIYRDLEREYQRLAGLYREIEGLQGDLDGIRRAYKDIYPRAGNVLDDFGSNWDNWSERVDQTNQTVVELSSIQLEDLIRDKSKTGEKVDSLLSTPAGRMQAIQAGNQLAAMQIQEAREMRALLAAAAQEQAAFNAKREKENQAAMEETRLFFAPRAWVDPKKATPIP